MIPCLCLQDSCIVDSWPGSGDYNDTFLLENKTNCCHEYHDEVEADSPQLNNYYLIQLVQDGVQGTGRLELSYLFYGYYPRHILVLEVAPEWKYNLPLAYLLVVVVTLILSLVLMVRAAARGLRESLRSSEGQFYQVCNVIVFLVMLLYFCFSVVLFMHFLNPISLIYTIGSCQ